MDEQLEILLHQYQNVASINVDAFNTIQLTNNAVEINEYDIRNVLSVTEVFDAEREANQIYRIYGRIEFMSILNGLKNGYNKFQDFFLPEYTGSSKNILNSFDFYLVRPSISGYTHIITGSSTNNSTITYNRFFTIIATPNQFDLFPVGFSNNVFGEQGYTYDFNVDIDVSSFQDQFGFPVTELFLYAQYKPALSPVELLAAKQWDNTGGVTTPNILTKSFISGDTVMSLNGQKFGDIIDYSKLDYLQVQLQPEQFYITTPYSGGTNRLIWKYNPFIPLRLRYLTDSVYNANISGTSYADVQSIPYYATSADTAGNYVWRYIMSEGYKDPLSGIGTDHPFVNKRRYLFTSIVLDVQPDLDDTETLTAFEQVWYARNSYKLNVTPTGDINKMGQPCQ